MKVGYKLCLILAAAALLATGAATARAAWFMDQARFHASAHGELGCLECHQSVAQDPAHPSPEKVDLSWRKLFKPKRCTTCHEEIPEQLAQGVHGGRKVKNPAGYQYCLRCHNPHTQPRLGENRIGNFQPGIPKSRQCAACHQEEKALPPPPPEEKGCYVCHMIPLKQTPAAARARQRFVCLTCHGKPGNPQAVRFDPADLATSPHAKQDCLTCHPGGDRFPHTGRNPAACSDCHPAHHDEAISGDLHRGVDCAGCHLKGMKVMRPRPGGPVLAEVAARPGEFTTAHQLADTKDQASCRRCHHAGNRVGAAAMVLPPKGLLCLPCHSATFTARDTVTQVGLAVFLLGLIGALSFWATGAGGLGAALAATGRAIFSSRCGRMLKALVLDGLLQRRLWRISPVRGLIHNLIFLPFLLRFTWGMVALMGSLIWPQADWPWPLLYKNAPATAFFFDLTGLMVLAGVAAAALRRLRSGRPSLPDLPRPDWPALGLLLGIVILGFLLEAMRIAMTGAPAGSGWAFIGYGLSRLLGSGQWLNSAYGYLWYAHAILTAGFAAYLPFSRMFHIILAPVLLMAQAADDKHHG